MRRAAVTAALLAVLALALGAASARAAGGSAGSAPAPKLTTTTNADPNALTDAGAPTVVPPGRYQTPRRVARTADAIAKVKAAERKYPGSYRRVFLKGATRWQVSYYDRSGKKEIAQVQIDDLTGAVTEAWTGYQVAWSMARGYPGAFGRRINALIVWLPLLALFLLPFVDRRRILRVAHLDLLVLVSFSVSLAFFNHGNIDASVPLAYPPLLYLLARMLWIGVTGRRGPPLTLHAPVSWVGIGLLFLLGFRYGLNVVNSNVIDVGYAGVIGAHKIMHGQELYGAFPTDNQHGDTYGPLVYLLYVPATALFGWSGRWDDLPAAHATAIGFDLLAVVLLWFLGRRLAGPAVALALAWAWAAFPFTAYALESNTNDSLVPAMLVLALLAAARPAARGASVALAGMAKFAPLGVGPILARRPADGKLLPGELLRYALGGAAVLALLLLPVALWWGGLHEMYDRTVAYQAHRGSPFSVWGLYQWLGLQHVVQLVAGLGCLLLFLVPRERDLGRSAALAAAGVIALQLGVTHWFYLYVVWFFPLVMIALCAPPAGRPDQGTVTDSVATADPPSALTTVSRTG
jgi:hypothetical protein